MSYYRAERIRDERLPHKVPLATDGSESAASMATDLADGTDSESHVVYVEREKLWELAS
jgi:hypothetical protein